MPVPDKSAYARLTARLRTGSPRHTPDTPHRERCLSSAAPVLGGLVLQLDLGHLRLITHRRPVPKPGDQHVHIRRRDRVPAHLRRLIVPRREVRHVRHRVPSPSHCVLRRRDEGPPRREPPQLRRVRQEHPPRRQLTGHDPTAFQHSPNARTLIRRPPRCRASPETGPSSTVAHNRGTTTGRSPAMFSPATRPPTAPALPLPSRGHRTNHVRPVGFQNAATGPDQRFHAAASYSLRSPPSIGRRRILPCTGSGTGDVWRGGRRRSARCGRPVL